MKATFIVAAMCGLLASVAFAANSHAAPAGAQPAATQPAPSTQDFVNKVAISDMFEIQASQLALEKQADKDTKPFAQRMVTRLTPKAVTIPNSRSGRRRRCRISSAIWPWRRS